jgi:hypothetical protein
MIIRLSRKPAVNAGGQQRIEAEGGAGQPVPDVPDRLGNGALEHGAVKQQQEKRRRQQRAAFDLMPQIPVEVRQQDHYRLGRHEGRADGYEHAGRGEIQELPALLKEQERRQKEDRRGHHGAEDQLHPQQPSVHEARDLPGGAEVDLKEVAVGVAKIAPLHDDNGGAVSGREIDGVIAGLRHEALRRLADRTHLGEELPVHPYLLGVGGAVTVDAVNLSRLQPQDQTAGGAGDGLAVRPLGVGGEDAAILQFLRRIELSGVKREQGPLYSPDLGGKIKSLQLRRRGHVLHVLYHPGRGGQQRDYGKNEQQHQGKFKHGPALLIILFHAFRPPSAAFYNNDRPLSALFKYGGPFFIPISAKKEIQA